MKHVVVAVRRVGVGMSGVVGVVSGAVVGHADECGGVGVVVVMQVQLLQQWTGH